MIGRLLKIFYKSSVVHNSLPVNFDKKDTDLFSQNERIKIPECGLYVLKNVFVTDLGIIYKDFVSLKENIICYDSDFKNYQFRYLIKSLLTFKKLNYTGGKCLIIFDNYSGPNGFAHWICDGLTRLAEMNDWLLDYTLIAPYYFKEEQLYVDSLTLFNVSAIHYLPKQSLTHFSELYFPGPIGDTGNFHPENIKKLREIVKSKTSVPLTTDNKLYISRAKASRRFVKNEEEVVTLLKRYNFSIIYLEEYSFPEQINIISSAATVISIHGAALAMLMFAKEGCSVMELRGEKDAINNMYYLLANVCKLSYYYLTCQSIQNSDTGNNFDLVVDLTQLEKNVKLMINEKQSG